MDPIEIAEDIAGGPTAVIWNTVKPYVLKTALYGSLAAFLFVSGCEYRVRTELKSEAAKVPAIVKTVTVREQHTQTVYIKDEAVTRKLAADNASLQNKIATLKDLVNRYVPDEEGGPGRYVSPCAVRLLNDAADGITTGTAVSAAVSACESAASGSLAWGRLVEDGIEIRGKYNALKAKDDSLIDWIDEHIVNAPITEPSATPN
jgi:hypothetical protein